MKILSRHTAILELSEEVSYAVDRVSTVQFLRHSTKEDLLLYIIYDLAHKGVMMNKELRIMARGELWCLFEEWGITDYVEETWLKIKWTGVNL